jgi:glycosyltransferase involved in cell wall biosynthesis
LYHNENKGKGAAVYTGFQNTQSDIVVIQDADLEYDPNDYSSLLKLIVEDKADVVYGTRLTNAKPFLRMRSFCLSRAPLFAFLVPMAQGNLHCSIFSHWLQDQIAAVY